MSNPKCLTKALKFIKQLEKTIKSCDVWSFTIFFSIIGNFDWNENELVYDSAMVGVISLLSWKIQISDPAFCVGTYFYYHKLASMLVCLVFQIHILS